MLSMRKVYDKDEMLEWYLDNTRSDALLYFPNEHNFIAPLEIVTYNVPEFLQQTFSTLYFRKNKTSHVLLYYIHGGKIYCTVVFPASLDPRGWPTLFTFFGERQPAKSLRRDWYLKEAPIEFLRGVDF